MDKVIIVESPSKSKTIKSFLNDEYEVFSSVGHIRDLSTRGKGGLGVDIEHGFKPDYIIIKNKEKIVKELKEKTENKEVYLATDLDREGESISWHLAQVLNLDIDKTKRIVFNEITKNKIVESIKNPRKIDMNLVSGQEARRILDRIIGFKLSSLLQNKIKVKSAGRVQSVALKLICDLDEEINHFIPEEYYEIEAIFDKFNSKLKKYKDEKIKISTLDEALKIINSLNKEFIVENIEYNKKKNASKPPFITSTMQQEASNKLNFTSSKTAMVAQSLYEGKEIGNETKGLITYMRTDSIRLSDEFVEDCNKFILNNYGKEYLGYVKHKKSKVKIQDAHEAIRPTDIKLTPNILKPYLNNDEYKLYTLIYNRALASLMADSLFESQKITLDNNSYKFETSISKNIFDGYLKVYNDLEDSEKEELNNYLNININDKLISNEINYKQLFTTPKPRYTEARLIKDLEEYGIGRPSTYATIITTLKQRNYIEVREKKFYPTEDGILANKNLQEHFKDIINVNFTANMEKKLDGITNGYDERTKILTDFYNDFEPLLEKAYQNMEKIKPQELDELCPLCGHNLVIRKGKYGNFIACSNYPECKYVKKEEKEKEDLLDIKCPKCGSPLVKRIAKKGRNKGKEFIACSNYPKCKYIMNNENNEQEEKKEELMDMKCPNCGGQLVKRIARRGKNKGKEFIACSNYPKCKYILNEKE